MKHCILFLAEGFEEVEAITVIDLLRRAAVKVTTVALEGIEVVGGHGIMVRADTTLAELPEHYDGVILPGGGGGTKKLADSDVVVATVRSAREKGLLCAAICAAPSVFAKAGILENTRATCYPGVEDELVGAGARFIDAAVVKDGNVITGRSAGTAIPFALELIATLLDQDAAGQIRLQIVY